jgi:hypothetical protein
VRFPKLVLLLNELSAGGGWLGWSKILLEKLRVCVKKRNTGRDQRFLYTNLSTVLS